MDYTSWNILQENLFNELFKIEDDYITLENLLETIKPISDVWNFLYQILLNDHSNDFDFTSSINEIKIIDGYLFIKLMLWDYVIIDIKDKYCLSDEEGKMLFNEDFFIKNFNETKAPNFSMYCFKDIGKKKTIDNVINYVLENYDILKYNNCFQYIINKDKTRVSLQINLDKQNAILSFFEFNTEGKNINNNYLYINNEYVLTSISNPTNNINSLEKMGENIKNIRIPKACLSNILEYFNVLNLTIKKA